MSYRPQGDGAGFNPSQPQSQYQPQGQYSQNTGGYQGQTGASQQDPDEDQGAQYQQHGQTGEGENDQYGQGQSQGGGQHGGEDGAEKKGGSEVASTQSKGAQGIKYSKFAQDPHHSKTMAHFHDVAANGFTEDHVQSLVHILTLLLAMLAHYTGMTAGHHATHEAAKAAHQGGKVKAGISN